MSLLNGIKIPLTHNSFVEENFGYKICKDVPTKNTTEQHEIDDEDESYEIHLNKIVPPDYITKFYPTNAYGTLNFYQSSFLLSTEAEYIRVADDDNISKIFEYMQLYWDILKPHKPRICISVAGELKDTKLLDSNKQAIIKGLVNIAVRTSTMFIATGIDFGVGKIVGEVKKTSHIIGIAKSKNAPPCRCLGVLPWGKVANSTDLINNEMNTHSVYYVSQHDQTSGLYALSSKYTHFVLLDDGFSGLNQTQQFNKQIGELEHQIAQQISDGGWGIPTVFVVIGGDFSMLEAIAIRLSLGTPVVILKDCGGIIQVIELLISRLQLNRSTNNFNTVMEDIIAFLKFSFKSIDEDSLKTCINSCKIISENLHLTLVCDANAETNFEELFEGILKISPNILTSLQLTLDWDRSDLARQLLGQTTNVSTFHELNNLFTQALINEQIEIIEAFMDNNFDTTSYFTISALQYLYQAAKFSEPLIRCLQYFGVKISTDANIPIKSVKAIVVYESNNKESTLSEDGNSNNKNIKLYHINSLLKKMIGHFNCTYYEYTKSASTFVLDNTRFKQPFQELFIWAILRQRYELAEFFWKKAENSLFLAIFGSCLIRCMVVTIDITETGAVDEMKLQANNFEELAIQIVTHSSVINPDIAKVLSLRTISSWGCKSIQWIGLLGTCRKFLGQFEIQNVIHLEWTNAVEANPIMLLFGFFCPKLVTSDRIFRLNYDKEICTLENGNNETNEQKNGTDKPFVQKYKSVYGSNRAKYFSHFIAYLVLTVMATVNMLVGNADLANYTTFEIIFHVLLLAKVMDGVTTIFKFWKLCGIRLTRFFLFLNFIWIEALLAVLSIIYMLIRCIIPLQVKVVSTVAALLLLGMYLGIFMYFAANRALGPSLITLSRMIIVTIQFIIVFLMILLPSGITQQGLLYPNRLTFEWSAVKDVLFYDYYRLFNVIQLENANAEKDGCGLNTTSNDCPTPNIIAPIIVPVYMLFASIFLINFLIAIFNNVISYVESEANELWKYNLLLQVHEYKCRYLFPPLNVIEYFIRLGVYSIHKCRKEKAKPTISDNEMELTTLNDLEQSSTTINNQNHDLNISSEIVKRHSYEQTIYAVEKFAKQVHLTSQEEIEKESLLSQTVNIANVFLSVINSSKEMLSLININISEKVKMNKSHMDFELNEYDYSNFDDEIPVNLEADKAVPPPTVDEISLQLITLEKNLEIFVKNLEKIALKIVEKNK